MDTGIDYERLKRRYFLKCGWLRFFRERDDAIGDYMKRCLKYRKAEGLGGADGNFAVLCSDDYWALQYQRLNFARQRARRACAPDGITSRVSTYTGDGPDTLKLGSVSIPGFTPEPDAVARERNAKQFHDWYRAKAMAALAKLSAMPDRGSMDYEASIHEQRELERELWESMR